jgi:ABC-2 type transport system permease protein
MNPTIARLSFQALLGRRRGLVLLVMPVILLGLAVAIRTLTEAGTGHREILSVIGLHLALPLVALLATSAVLGPEVDDGSIVYLLAKPVNRYVVGSSKYLVAALATLVFGALPLLIAGLINDSDAAGDAVAYLVGGAVAGLAYAALFLALCALTRHAVVIGLLFVFLWEGVLGGLLSGIDYLSVGAWADQIVAEVSDRISMEGSVGLAYAVLASLVVIVGSIALTGWRLSSFSMAGET